MYLTRYCTSILSSLGFQMRRCVAVASTGKEHATFALRSREAVTPGVGAGTAPGSCLSAPGSFRLLERVPCSAAAWSQRWLYDESTGAFSLALDAAVCLRYVAEALSFGAWVCTNTADQRFSVSANGADGPSAYCAAASADACVSVAD